MIKIAYLVLAHTDPKQIKRLVNKLTATGDVYLHINKLVEIEPFIEEIGENNKKLFYADKRYKVHWGGWSIVAATFQLLGQALKNCDYDRITLLTGMDYPLQSSDKIREFFCGNYMADFINTQVIERESKLNNIKQFNYNDANPVLLRIYSAVKRMLPARFFEVRKAYITINNNDIPFCGLSPKWSLTGSSAKKIYNFYKNNPGINRTFKYMHAPDDIYVATIYSSLMGRVGNACKIIFYENSGNDTNTSCITLKYEHWDGIVSSNCLFGRKFNSTISAQLLDTIDLLDA